MAARVNRRLKIASEYYHYNARLIADGFPSYPKEIRRALQQSLSLPAITRKDGRPGIEAADLNASIKSHLRKMKGSGLRFECRALDGYFVSEGRIAGFDFAFVDEAFNTISFRNRCLGPVHFHDGDDRWRRRAEIGIKELPRHHAVHRTQKGDLVDEARSAPIILGEIQFGNWGLAHADLFKALEALESTTFDLFVYVCATGHLHEMLSRAIVTFDRAKALLQRRIGMLRFPVWLVGLDLES